MKICVFDTETTSLEKPFCYNVGFVLYDTDTDEILHKAEFCVEQIWHNLELFSSAYYAAKRPQYVAAMKGRKIRLDKWGYIMQKMARLFKEYEIEAAFAYNSAFDERVFNFNCDWFKVRNPFDTVPIYDIRGYVHQFIAFTKAYQNFCEEIGQFTESGNYSTTAESVFRYISEDWEFEEEHTALADAEIEMDILRFCVANYGAEWAREYKTYNSIPRRVMKTLSVFDKIEGRELLNTTYTKIRINKEKTKITIE